MRYPLIIVLLITFTACGHTDSPNVMLKEILLRNENSPKYASVQKEAYSQIHLWINTGIQEARVLRECPWKLDKAVFFNSTKDRAYLLLLIQDNLTEAELDYVYVLYAALEKDKWDLYFAGLPNLVFPRPNHSEHPLSWSELSEMARMEMSKSYLDSKGKVNDTFVNRADFADLKARKLKFLNQK